MNQIKIHQIKNTDDQHFAEFWKIYNASFPLNEKRTSEQQNAVLKKPGYRVDLYLSVNQAIGFIAFWELMEFVFIEHFAVAPEFRSKGFGIAILRPFILGKTKLVILEIDPPVDELTNRRLRFYSSLGFVKNDFVHFQPSYRPGELPHLLTLLSWPDLINEENYQQFSQFQKNSMMD